MKIIGRTLRDGKPFGFMVDDGGLIIEVLDRGLYQEMYLSALVESGYKILDYNCNIISPDGINILDLATQESTTSDDEVQMLVDEAESAMAESECLRYFTIDTSAEQVVFKECVDPEIKTREEFIKYLMKCKQQYLSSGQCYDCRPINSFVAKEALFEISEANLDKEVREYFHVMAKRRCLPSYSSYENLVKYLISKGVLDTDTPTPTQLMQAYAAWGIDGIKTPCFRQALKMNVDGEINAMNEAATLTTVYSNRRSELVLMDRNGKLYSGEDMVDGYEVEVWGREVIVPAAEERYNEALGTSGSWKTPYRILPGLVVPNRDRMYFDLMTDDGYPYTVKIQHDKMCFFDSYSNFLDVNYIIIKGMDGKYMTLEDAPNKNEYYLTNMCVSKAYDMINSVTKKAPVDNSYELYRREGLNPEAAIKYIARRINDNVYGCATTSEYGKCNFWQASDMYRVGPTQALIDKYNPNNEPYANLDELIEIMLDTQAAMINDGTYAMSMDSNLQSNEGGIDAGQDTEQELRMKPLESLGFVKSCFEGNIAIDFLGDGIEKDNGDDIRSIAHLLRTMINVAIGKDATIQEKTSFLRSIESDKRFDMSTLLYPRDNAYRGYLKDRAILNGRRGAESCYVLYVTKIFREIANVPANKCRHYAVEAFALDVRERQSPKNRKIQIALADAIKASAKNAGLTGDKWFIVEKQCMDIASQTFISMIFNTCELTKVDTGYRLEVAVGDVKLPITVDEETVQYIRKNDWASSFKYITLCDYCINEIAPANKKFNFYCINADIDPWTVRPKEGVSIPEYNFFVNFCAPEWFSKFSDSWKESVDQNKSKPVTLYNRQFSANIVEYTSLDIEEDKAPQDVTTIDACLDEVVAETFNLYRQRFVLHNTDAKKKGNYLVRMRLKSDVRFYNYASKCGALALEEDEYAEMPTPKIASTFAQEHIPQVMYNHTYALTTVRTGSMVRQFTISEFSYNDSVRWYPIMSGNFVPKGAVYGYCGHLMIVHPDGKVTKLKINETTTGDAEELCRQNLAYQLSHNKYYIQAANGEFVLEVE